MPRTPINLKIQLVDLLCHDEADGPGSAEPYLWPVFFKIDGDSFAVDSVGLIGFPTVIATDGSHENLGDTDVDEGDRVPIPEAIGTLTTELKPIPVNDPTFRMVLGDDLPGIAGAVVVLMEQDSWPDDLATTGYNALVNAVQLGVAKAAASFQHATAAPTPDEIAAQVTLVKDLASKMVRGAILDHMSGGQIGWYGTVGNNDDQIGTEAWTINQDEFSANNDPADTDPDPNVITFVRRWKGDESDGNGDWEITVSFINEGSIVARSVCVEIAGQIKQLEKALITVTDTKKRNALLRVVEELKHRATENGCAAA